MADDRENRGWGDELSKWSAEDEARRAQLADDFERWPSGREADYANDDLLDDLDFEADNSGRTTLWLAIGSAVLVILVPIVGVTFYYLSRML